MMNIKSTDEIHPCRICGSTSSVVADASIFPKAVFRKARAAQGEEPFLLAIDRHGSKPKKVRIGEYDSNLLCVDCEQKFSPIDDRGLRALQAGLYIPVPCYGKKQLVLKYSDKANAQDLRLFLLFILLRASWSSREAYKHVQLGADLERHLLRAAQDGIEPAGIEFRILLFQHKLIKGGLLSTPAVHSGAIFVWPGAGQAVFRLGIHDMSALVLVGETVLNTPQTARISLQPGERCRFFKVRSLMPRGRNGWRE